MISIIFKSLFISICLYYLIKIIKSKFDAFNKTRSDRFWEDYNKKQRKS